MTSKKKSKSPPPLRRTLKHKKERKTMGVFLQPQFVDDACSFRGQQMGQTPGRMLDIVPPIERHIVYLYSVHPFAYPPVESSSNMGCFEEIVIAVLETSPPFKVFKVGSTCHHGEAISDVRNVRGRSATKR